MAHLSNPPRGLLHYPGFVSDGLLTRPFVVVVVLRCVFFSGFGASLSRRSCDDDTKVLRTRKYIRNIGSVCSAILEMWSILSCGTYVNIPSPRYSHQFITTLSKAIRDHTHTHLRSIT